MILQSDALPLISVIIPSYNYARFLSKAIDSVLHQTYPNIEVIVIDDGSADHTRLVAQGIDRVHYFYQRNKGLAAARNAGIEKARGDYFVFLDADDWLERDALEQNYAVIKNKPQVAFVSGNYYLLRVAANTIEPVTVSVTEKPYTRLLQSNYIGMHAAVMFQRWVFAEMRHDESLKSCEDYDLYLRIARRLPVLHHQAFIATYYFHSSGLSHNYQAMMDSIIAVIKKQEIFLQSEEERKAYGEGLKQWKQYQLLLETCR